MRVEFIDMNSNDPETLRRGALELARSMTRLYADPTAERQYKIAAMMWESVRLRLGAVGGEARSQALRVAVLRARAGFRGAATHVRSREGALCS